MNSLINHLKRQNISSFNPILISDIDGVLVRGSTPIKTTLSALKKVK
jgi:ribonucleotide monophosphatase NagD (HAD superfamily)